MWVSKTIYNKTWREVGVGVGVGFQKKKKKS